MKISLYLASGIAVFFFIIGLACGFYATPEYRSVMYEKNSMSLGQADRTFDLRYINAMIAHHRGAMLLAEQLQKNTKRPEMQSLAEAILADEPKAIAQLYQWKKEWYGDARIVRDPLVAKLGSSDEKFDLRFLNAMIAHHELGIRMTTETRLKSSRTEILNNADAVEDFLDKGIESLKNLRSSWYTL
jgi:uncharacterized protein (DUF305 family)